jgi:uncharacterized iron-regulated protein
MQRPRQQFSKTASSGFHAFATTGCPASSPSLLWSTPLMTVALLFAVLSFIAVNRTSAATPPAGPADADKGLRLTEHPLAGRIIDMRTARATSADAVRAEVARMSVVLLGETHDNIAHHALHLSMLEAATANGRRPALAMEQFDRTHQAAIDMARMGLKQDAEKSGSTRPKFLHEAAEAIATAGQLNRTGWKWPQYQPLVETAINLDLPMVAANLSRAEAREVFRSGFSSLPQTIDRAHLARTWNAAKEGATRAIMAAGHCGQLPASMAPGMVNAQRARDAVMADALLSRASVGAVFIAGRGHVRRDVGVPLYLADRDARLTTLVIGFIEVAEGRHMLADYAETQSEIARPFDIVWFTPRQERKDPCAGLSLDKLKPTASTAATPAADTTARR